MIRCLIVDDEKPSLARMRLLLSAHPDMEVIGEAGNVGDALGIYRKGKPDLVFLDTQLGGESGFNFLERLEKPLPHIVFVTAHSHYAIRAFEFNALDYLLKPVEPGRLEETLRRARTTPHPPSAAKAEHCAFVKMSKTTRFVPWNEILSVKSEGNYTRLFLKNGSTSLVLRTLKEWEKIAPSGHFLQVHRSMLVCGRVIREIRSTEEGRHVLVLIDGREIPVGRAFWPKVKAVLPHIAQG